MTPTETVGLLRIVHALCPAQKIDEYTPDAWGEVLADVALGDAKAAIKAVARRQPFIAPADIVAEVRRIRRDRLESVPEAIPDADPDDVPAYLAAVRQGRSQVAGGGKPRPVAALTAKAFRRPA